MRQTVQPMKISALAFILAFVASTALAADTVRTLPNTQSPKQSAPVQSQIKPASLSDEIIQCPEIKGTTLIFKIYPTAIPAGWTFPDQGSNATYVFQGISVFGNSLYCRYNAGISGIANVFIIRPIPIGKTCRAIDGKYFLCQ